MNISMPVTVPLIICLNHYSIFKAICVIALSTVLDVLNLNYGIYTQWNIIQSLKGCLWRVYNDMGN